METPQSVQAHDRSTHCQLGEGPKGNTRDLQPTNTCNNAAEDMNLRETNLKPANYKYCKRIQCEEDGMDNVNLDDENLQCEMVTTPRNDGNQDENIRTS